MLRVSGPGNDLHLSKVKDFRESMSHHQRTPLKPSTAPTGARWLYRRIPTHLETR